MADISFIGLGKMGFPMTRNLVKSGHNVRAYDKVPDLVEMARQAGAQGAASLEEAVSGAETVISMVRAGAEAREIYTQPAGVLDRAAEGALLIDSSTIDLDTVAALGEAAAERGFDMIDAPVTGSVIAAEAGTLTFMVGGTSRAFARAKPILETIAANVFHAGPSGSGMAVKLCNNMLVAINMIGVCEGLMLGKRLGVDAKTLFSILSVSSCRSWALNDYCPLPGMVPAAPSNRDWEPGFTAELMVKDLRLAQQAAQSVDAATPLGAAAGALMSLYCNAGNQARDFSGIIKMIGGDVLET